MRDDNAYCLYLIAVSCVIGSIGICIGAVVGLLVSSFL